MKGPAHAPNPLTTRASIVSALAAALVVAAAALSGTINSTNTTLVVMGFDPDRAQLISALIVGGIAGAVAFLAANRLAEATVSGLAAVFVVFGQTFIAETQAALAASGVGGSFDPIGWLLTLLTLLLIGTIAAWAGATLASGVRPALIAMGREVADGVQAGRFDREQVRRPLAAALILALLVVCVPIFGDMVNFTPDSHMVRGGPPPVGLISGPGSGPADSIPPVTSVGGSVPSQAPGGTLSPGTNSNRPWLAWIPSGNGNATVVDLPAPWKGGTATTDNVTIYTPPGYDSSPLRSYPVLYEAPKQFHDWYVAAHVTTILDSLIDTGAIPPMIVVFVADIGGPYPDTECANSVDGKQWMDTFISKTVVSYVDSHFRTIATPDARATIGFSQGGYCAAILALHHPDVFGTSIPISGYFEAGQGDPTSALPFGGQAAAIAAASPLVVATQLPPAARAGLFFILVAPTTQSIYGIQATNFQDLLAKEGYQYMFLQSQPAARLASGQAATSRGSRSLGGTPGGQRRLLERTSGAAGFVGEHRPHAH